MKNNTDNWKRFGRWVAQKREEKGLVQADLGNRIGRDRQTVYRIEAGEPTKRPTVIRIAEALGEPVAVALGIAFGPDGHEPPALPQESEILSYLQELPLEQRENIVVMLRALIFSWLQHFSLTHCYRFCIFIPSVDGCAPITTESVRWNCERWNNWKSQ